MKENRYYSLWLIFTISLIIRILYAFFIAEDIFVGDAKGYYDHTLYLLGQAESIDFKWISFWSPGESLYLLPWIFCLGKAKWVVVVSMLAVWTAFFFLFEKWTSAFLQKDTRLLLLTIFSLYPAYIHHSIVPLTHLPATTCTLAVFYFLQKKTATFIGTIFGFLLLIRPANLLLGLIFPFFIKTSKRFLIIFFIAFSIVASWSFYLYQKTNTFIFVSESNGYNLYLGNHPETPLYATWWWASHTWEKTRLIKQETDTLLSLPAGKIGKGFQKLAIQYIQESPKKFVLRSLNRLRTLFAFDTFTGTMLAEKHSRIIVFSTIGADAFFYGILMSLFLGQFFLPDIFHNFLFRFQIGSILLISFPYFFSFSHPTYHFSLMPIIALGAGLFWENRKNASFTLSFWQKSIAIILCACFVIIQIEWLFFWLGNKI